MVLSFKDSSFRFAPFGKTQLLGSFGGQTKNSVFSVNSTVRLYHPRKFFPSDSEESQNVK